ncbi:hypothetical protein [Bradyrhizobium sp. sBnM-33]|jgi:hypothetical protein|uniref:hypothetical protein n=1 Tax=Bradyrhizobium sp. sBnM-33 TaxID=2831780 RepID=UPI001BCB7041|nr:hypothetical protein [Bradyrhizobium sp. sBnM-33]WOH53695.1 hypothetical protein RX328_17380 [Bradyrhizobium sp. sBnM-33]
MEALFAACLIGVFSGLYYKFLITIPLTLVAVIACAASAAWHGQTVSAAFLNTVMMTVALQGGYMIGLTSRDLLSQILSRLHAAPSRRA